MIRRAVLLAVVAAFVAAPASAARGPINAARVRPTTVYVGAPLPTLSFHTTRAATLSLVLVRCGKRCESTVTIALVKERFAAGTHKLGIATLLRLSSIKPRLTHLPAAVYAVVFQQGTTVLGSTDFGVDGKA